MGQSDYKELNNTSFLAYAADPSALGSGDSDSLERSLEKFPYCQLLHLFYTRSLSVSDSPGLDKQLSKTALLVPDRIILYTILKEAEKLKDNRSSIPANHTKAFEPEGTKETVIISDNPVEDIPAASDEAISNNYAINQETATIQPEVIELEEDKDKIETSEQPGNDTGVESLSPEYHAEPAEIDTENGSDQTANIHNSDNSENATSVSEDHELETLGPVDDAAEEYLADEKTEEASVDEIASIEEPSTFKSSASEQVVKSINPDQEISKYDDDKLPYSFLWWLNKTRKEHSDNYQPYVDFKLDTSQSIKRTSVDQLSSQIIENIFHLQSPVELLENSPKTVPFQVKRKEDFILEKFIKEEPQLKAPNSQKLDTENKARKSAEDANDLVSETLAQIYTDQMLYHKAIDTYKKLSLKFPKKSTYFADQIRELEKK